MAKDKANSAALPYVALVLACIIPGAGHVYIGRVKRGIIILVTIAALFWTGVGGGGGLGPAEGGRSEKPRRRDDSQQSCPSASPCVHSAGLQEVHAIQKRTTPL